MVMDLSYRPLAVPDTIVERALLSPGESVCGRESRSREWAGSGVVTYIGLTYGTCGASTSTAHSSNDPPALPAMNHGG